MQPHNWSKILVKIKWPPIWTLGQESCRWTLLKKMAMVFIRSINSPIFSLFALCSWTSKTNKVTNSWLILIVDNFISILPIILISWAHMACLLWSSTKCSSTFCNNEPIGDKKMLNLLSKHQRSTLFTIVEQPIFLKA